MKYMILYFVVPAAAVSLIQSILCRKVRKGLLRHGALIFPMISIVVGIVTLFTRGGDVFSGLGAVAALLWFANACCTAFGYGAAWFVFWIAGKGRNKA